MKNGLLRPVYRLLVTHVRNLLTTGGLGRLGMRLGEPVCRGVVCGNGRQGGHRGDPDRRLLATRQQHDHHQTNEQPKRRAISCCDKRSGSFHRPSLSFARPWSRPVTRAETS